MIATPPHGPVPAIALAVCLAVLLSANAEAQKDHRSATPDAARTVLQARIDTAIVEFPVIDGTDIRFARPYAGEGLSQTKVAQIVQDDQGFMWFGTQYGLNRFDGYNFKVFVHDPRNLNSLSGVFINSLFKDRDGTLWVGCDQFLNKFNRATETFTRYAVPAAYHISQDTNGMLWLSTATGLYGLDPATGDIRRYAHDPNDPASLSSNDVKSSGEDRTGRFWVATREGMDEFDRRTGKITLHIPLRELSLGFSFFEDRFGVFWIFHVSDSTLAVFDRKTNTLTRYSFHDRNAPDPALTGITGMIEDRGGTLWLGTNGAGLLKFDREHRRFIRYRNNPANPETLGQDSVISLFRDRQGIMWAGLGGMGPTRFATNPLPFKRFRRDFGDPNRRGERFVGAIYVDREGILWIGSHEGLTRVDGHGGHDITYTTAGPGGGVTDVITIREDRSGNLWVGTYNHGLYRFDRRAGHFKTFRHNPTDPHSLSNDIVTRLLVDHNGTLWAATFDGLNRFDAATERFTTYKLDPQNRNPFYLELVEDSEGALWLGTHASGLERFDPGTGKFTLYQQDLNRAGTLSDNRVNSVHFDRSGTMWVGTQDGLNAFDPKTGGFTAYTQRDGLPSNAVGCILEDDKSYLWMSTNNGVARFDPQRKTVENYSTADGLPGPDLTGWGACFKSASGEMFFGGFSGATAFFPEKVADPVYVSPIVLTDFKLFGNSVIAGPGSPLKQTINHTNAITLSHKQDIFSIEFSALSYFNPATNRYRYTLEGLDQQWHQVGSDQRLASYTTLPPGKYTFRVQGATIRGAWSEPGAALDIEILPPWWGTWWFTATYLTVIVLLGVSAYRYRLHQIAQQYSLRLEERVSERTRLARELHDTLLQTIQASKMVADDALDEVTDLTGMRLAMKRLSNWLGQATEEGRAALNSLRASTVQEDDLLEAIRRATEEVIARSSMKVEFAVKGIMREMHPLLRAEVYCIACEGIRNACLHSEGSRVDVELHYADEFVLRMTDNGKGIPEEIADGGKLGHFGLQGMRERAARIGGRLSLVTSATSGTQITLRVPGILIFNTASLKPSSRPGRIQVSLRQPRRKDHQD